MAVQEKNDQHMARRAKLEELREHGIEAYPPGFVRTHTVEELKRARKALLSSESEVSYAGRVMRLNRKGRITFLHLKDGSGRLQAVLSESEIGSKAYQVLKLVDIGDWLGIRGHMFETHSGEYSVRTAGLSLLSKALRPLPTPKEKQTDGSKTVTFDRFADIETRYRQRYIDLTLNDDVREVFRKRSAVVQAMRRFLDDLDYLEVETPVLQPVYGGANARPFETHHFAQGIKLYLRVSNELYLKRCIIGGLERVYEFARDFRNEGIDRTHNPEFTLLEFYESFADYRTMMDRVEALCAAAARAVAPDMQISWNENDIDMGRPWKRIRLLEAVSARFGRNIAETTVAELHDLCAETGIESDKEDTRGTMLLALFEHSVAPGLIQPHIVYDFPKESSPLCRPHRTVADLIEQFEVYIGGVELCNAYSELVDPIVQRSAFERQAEAGRGKSEEAHPLDEDFLFALESGMPPTGGVGIGIDRLVMLLTGADTIRDVTLFPLMKAKA